jgi:hypothetical protein
MDTSTRVTCPAVPGYVHTPDVDFQSRARVFVALFARRENCIVAEPKLCVLSGLGRKKCSHMLLLIVLLSRQAPPTRFRIRRRTKSGQF